MNMCKLNFIAIAFAGFLIGCDGDARPFTEAVEVRTLNLQSLEPVPPTNSQQQIFLNPNEGIQFGIRGLNGSNQTVVLPSENRAWSVSDGNVATINKNGFLTALANGTVDVSVSIGGIGSSTYALTVANATLSSVSDISGSASLERCIPGDYFATGTFSDNTVRNLSNVSWTLNNSSVAELFETTGTATRLNAFNASDALQITATVPGVSAFSKAIVVQNNLQTITIGPGPLPIEIDENDELNLTAVGTYIRANADNATATSQTVITANVQWSIASGTDNASVSNVRGTRGLLTGLDEGTAQVLVTCGSVAPRATINVDEAGTDSTSSTLSFQVNNVAVGSTLVLNRATTSTVIPLRVSTGSSYDIDDDITEDISFVTEFIGTALDNPPFEILGTGADRSIQLLGQGQGIIRATVIADGEPTVPLTITVE